MSVSFTEELNAEAEELMARTVSGELLDGVLGNNGSAYSAERERQFTDDLCNFFAANRLTDLVRVMDSRQSHSV
ncbi:MAG: hypothetical protein LBI44_08430 [Oscillospiraceae bacterium]|nr:hypothetical protein [Oscillospiraceae bacterium]